MKTGKSSNGLFIYAIGYLVFLYAPVLLLPIFSFNDSIYVAFPLKGFTLNSYDQMIDNPDLLDALLASFQTGVVVAVISTALGLLAAKAVTHYYLPGRIAMTGFIMLPLVVPPLVMAVALLFLLR